MYRSLADGETVTDEYTFTSSDGQLHPVSVTLVGVNDAPQYQGEFSLDLDSNGTYVFSDQDVTAFDPMMDRLTSSTPSLMLRVAVSLLMASWSQVLPKTISTMGA